MPWKLYCDSRFRVQTGGESSDAAFSIELPHPIRVKGKAFVDCFVCNNSFFSIRTGENDRIHVREGAAQPYTHRIPTIAEGQYNATSLKAALLTALQIGKSLTANYTVAYDDTTGNLTVGLDGTGSEAFSIYPAGVLKNQTSLWNAHNSGILVDPKNLKDSGGVTGFAGDVVLSADQILDVTAPDSFNVQPYGQLFLRSSLGSGYDAIGADGSGDIIRRILCQVPLNDTIVDQHSLPHDAVTLHDMEIASLSFRLTDIYGKTVNTHGHPISFSIIFIEDQ